MLETLPPGPSTAPPPRRLRVLAAGIVVVAFASAGFFPARPAAAAKSTATKVLLGATVSDAAAASMSQALWAKIVADFIGGDVVQFANGLPTIDDCKKSGAEYVVDAPFDLRPKLPGIPYASDRTPAQTHITVVNCVTGTALFDKSINFDSDPQANQPEGDFDSVPEISWSKSVPATLRKYAVAFPRIARIVQIDSPFAFVDMPSASVRPGQGLRDFARADRKQLAQPIILTVTSVEGRYVEVQYSTLNGAAQPALGDLVEPLTETAPAPVSPSPKPSAS